MNEYEFLVYCNNYFALYISVWACAFQLVYFNIYTAIDFITLYYKDQVLKDKLNNDLHKIGSYLLFTIVFPVSTAVAITFWSIFLWDREIIYPKIIDYILPPVLNHMMHTVPIPIIVIYMATTNKFQPPRTKALLGLLTFLTIYFACTAGVKVKYGQWMYPLLENQHPGNVKYIFLLGTILSISILYLGYGINTIVTSIKTRLKL